MTQSWHFESKLQMSVNVLILRLWLSFIVDFSAEKKIILLLSISSVIRHVNVNILNVCTSEYLGTLCQSV
jgi:diacylglycerol kinase